MHSLFTYKAKETFGTTQYLSKPLRIQNKKIIVNV